MDTNIATTSSFTIRLNMHTIALLKIALLTRLAIAGSTASEDSVSSVALLSRTTLPDKRPNLGSKLKNTSGIPLTLNKALVTVQVHQTPVNFTCHCCYESVRRGLYCWGKRIDAVNSVYLATAFRLQPRLGSINHAILSPFHLNGHFERTIMLPPDIQISQPKVPVASIPLNDGVIQTPECRDEHASEHDVVSCSASLKR